MIPSVAHFVWFGSEFPWLNVLAIVSAAASGGFERIVLHLDGPPEVALRHAALVRLEQLEVRRIDFDALAERAGFDAASVRSLLAVLRSHAARSDVVRALLLLGEGGVYLDMDTVTVASLGPLRARASAFVGQEPICFPGWSLERPTLKEFLTAQGLASLRLLLRVAPRGHRLWRGVSRWYSLNVNNAVVGCEAQHPLIRAYLHGMLSMPPALARRPYAIGPDLLARVCRPLPDSTAFPVELLSPEYFYPIPPVISEHWWRFTARPELDEVLSENTLVVHWYASVRGRKRARQVDPEYVRAHSHHQLFARLAARYIDKC